MVKNAKGTSVLSKFTYTLDPVGNPTQVVTPTSTTTYDYDSLDRLTEVCFQATCPAASDPYTRWGYDSVGNRTSETEPSGTTSYAYNAADQLLSAGTTTYAYDPNGNQTQAGTRTFSYDLANRLTSTTSGTTTTTYGYDGEGKRLLASTGSAATQNTKYLWDPNQPLYELALERDGNNALLRRYIHGVDMVSMFTGGANYYYHRDGLGSVVNVTSATGGSQWTYAYEPFGANRTQTKNNTNAPANVMRFTGQLRDSTGLYHLRARQYDGSTGRFLQVDPVRPVLEDPYIGAYIYANNRPTVFMDPTGMFAWGNFLSWTSLALSGAALVLTGAAPLLAVGLGAASLLASAGSTGARCYHAVDAGCAFSFATTALNAVSWGVGTAANQGLLTASEITARKISFLSAYAGVVASGAAFVPISTAWASGFSSSGSGK
jgi:RHS repeat-associated protein